MMYGIAAHYKLIKRLSFWYAPVLRKGQVQEFLDACVDRFYSEFPEPDDGDPPYLLAQRRAIKTDFILKDIVWASWARRGVEPDITWQEALQLDASEWEKYLTALEKRHGAAGPPRAPGYTAVKRKYKVGDTTPNGVVLVVDSSDSETDTASIRARHGHSAGPSCQVTVTVYDSDGEELGTAKRVPVYNSDGEEIGAVAGPLTEA
ncbi:hypothetical protein CC1G_13016 [Coprinopsis cinerea okayama7|uniref:Uncharacterized protein n=1 Tax=Coprinopsis cinerea (strain Okayama-7 / 130 / ATCC MYA-4618 / FGSC 9003) TaxID=240176 RepID=D6RK98_COPC7|nr:hypothetical protein CC1G_13016 [Coprinopsis cinerea okayama7\|eukprot:XP_002912259.1 hypothetical protein CC1G_13016 [Coprinopsis cinerea okayama7\